MQESDLKYVNSYRYLFLEKVEEIKIVLSTTIFIHRL